jgi:hypothetical protein
MGVYIKRTGSLLQFYKAETVSSNPGLAIGYGRSRLELCWDESVPPPPAVIRSAINGSNLIYPILHPTRLIWTERPRRIQAETFTWLLISTVSHRSDGPYVSSSLRPPISFSLSPWLPGVGSSSPLHGDGHPGERNPWRTGGIYRNKQGAGYASIKLSGRYAPEIQLMTGMMAAGDTWCGRPSLRQALLHRWVSQRLIGTSSSLSLTGNDASPPLSLASNSAPTYMICEPHTQARHAQRPLATKGSAWASDQSDQQVPRGWPVRPRSDIYARKMTRRGRAHLQRAITQESVPVPTDQRPHAPVIAERESRSACGLV